MEASLTNDGTVEQSKSKVSISARLIPALIYLIPIIGAALSAFLQLSMIQRWVATENVIAEAVFEVFAESIYPVLGSLYLQIILGIAVLVILIVRMVMETKTASPSSWFFVISGILCLIPLITLFESQSMVIEVLIDQNAAGVEAVGSIVSILLIFIMAALPITFFILIALSLIPFTTKKRPRWSPLITFILMEIPIIAVTVAFQLRFLWLYKATL